jgi:hypothetical protein
MKRDMDLIREILLEVEKRQGLTGWLDLQIPSRDTEEVAYHVKLLDQAGYLQATDLSSHDGFYWAPKSLTWEGHEFLDAARNETVWAKAKSFIRENGGSVPLEVVKAFMVQVATSFLPK